jgi:hypothetical protein
VITPKSAGRVFPEHNKKLKRTQRSLKNIKLLVRSYIRVMSVHAVAWIPALPFWQTRRDVTRNGTRGKSISESGEMWLSPATEIAYFPPFPYTKYTISDRVSFLVFITSALVLRVWLNANGKKHIYSAYTSVFFKRGNSVNTLLAVVTECINYYIIIKKKKS